MSWIKGFTNLLILIFVLFIMIVSSFDGFVVAFQAPQGVNMAEIFNPLPFILGGKYWFTYCHLILNPLFKHTPNEAEGGIPYLVVKVD